MDRQEALRRVKEIVGSVLSFSPEGINESDRFEEDLKATSLDKVEIGIMCEDEFGDIKDEEDVKTVGELVTKVMEIADQFSSISGKTAERS
jgi:acyl carrier protein